MNPDTLIWLRIGHVIGFVFWITGIVAVLQLLRIHSTIESGATREVLTRYERRAAILMDLGATLTIVCGLWRALGPKVTAFETGGWLHVKLTLVAIFLLGTHGWARVQVKRFRKGQVRHVPTALLFAVLLAAMAIIVLGAHPTLLRK
jgi:putative membrane protein